MADLSTKHLLELSRLHQKGEWKLVGNKVVVKDSFYTIAQVTQLGCGELDLYESANAELITLSPLLLKEVLNLRTEVSSLRQELQTVRKQIK